MNYKENSDLLTLTTVILLVDDQSFIAEALKRSLASVEDIILHYCQDPKQVMAMIREVRPTCILQDLVMPEADGLDMLALYRENKETRNIPVVILSSREEPEIKSKAFSLGANDYMVKIPDRIELIARIKYHSRAFIIHQQRDAAYKALEESQRRLEEANKQLQKLSAQDGLTNIPNRRRFDEVMHSEWHRAMRHCSTLSVIMIDIDFFKLYNDHYGHQDGDHCLRKVASLLRGSIQRESDMLARYGGEEFAVILPETGIHGASEVAEQMRKQILDAEIPHQQSTVCPFITISIGVAAAVPERSSDPDGLIKAADKALYQSKQAGRNQVTTFFELLVY